MSTPTDFEGFPLEVWLRILDYCTPSIHRTLYRLSSAFHQITRKRLYHTLVFGNQVYLGYTKETAYDGTWCRDLELFYKLHKNRNDWKPYVHRVYIQCYTDGTKNRIFDGDASMFSKVASLFKNDASAFTSLEFFHTTLPYMQGTFWDNGDSDSDASSDDGITDQDDDKPHKRLPSCGITSMSLAMQDDQGIEYEWLDQLSSIIEEAPKLRFLELREWSETDHPAMDQFSDEPRTWSATHLSLLECGPLTEDVNYLLEKFRDLQSLRVTSGLLPNSKYDGSDDHILIQTAIDSLGAVKDNLLELEFDPGPSEHWRQQYQWPNNQSLETYLSIAFTDFFKLRRLQAPLEMFSQATDKMSRDDELHDFHTNFPPTLEELTLVVTCRERFHQALEGAYVLSSDQVVIEDCTVNITELKCEMETYEKAHELFGELSRLAVHRDLVPALRELHLLRDPCQWLDCEHVKQDIRLLEEAGIAVHVRDRQIEGPTQSKHKRMTSELD